MGFSVLISMAEVEWGDGCRWKRRCSWYDGGLLELLPDSGLAAPANAVLLASSSSSVSPSSSSLLLGGVFIDMRRWGLLLCWSVCVVCRYEDEEEEEGEWELDEEEEVSILSSALFSSC